MNKRVSKSHSEEVSHEEMWNQCIERITYLEELIAIEEIKLFEAIKKNQTRYAQ